LSNIWMWTHCQWLSDVWLNLVPVFKRNKNQIKLKKSHETDDKTRRLLSHLNFFCAFRCARAPFTSPVWVCRKCFFLRPFRHSNSSCVFWTAGSLIVFGGIRLPLNAETAKVQKHFHPVLFPDGSAMFWNAWISATSSIDNG
jgi:hypothetical protein